MATEHELLAEIEEFTDGDENSYVIDPEWYVVRRQSLAHVVGQRRCGSCDLSGTKKTRRRKGPPSEGWQAQMQAVAACCSDKPGYILWQTPVLEAVFRTLLANGNEPMNAQELADSIREWWLREETSRDISGASLAQLLERQHTYGFAAVGPQP